MKVLIADKFERVGIDGLKELGCAVVIRPEVKAEELPAVMREVDPHILIVRSKKVSAAGRVSADRSGRDTTVQPSSLSPSMPTFSNLSAIKTFIGRPNRSREWPQTNANRRQELAGVPGGGGCIHTRSH
jgi:hypothetical protein